MAWAAGAAMAAASVLVWARRPRRRAFPAKRQFALARLKQTWYFDAPRSKVFAYWTAFSAFPDFLEGVESVLSLGNNHYLFELKAPGGGLAFWEAVLTRFENEREMAWESDPFSSVQCRGSARFRREGGRTAVDLEAEYGPGAPWIAEGMERFLGRELPGLLSRDLVRMKNLIETGSADL
jgi:uncharacterized membrane protein